MSKDKKITLCKAEPTGNKAVDNLTIEISQPIPELDEPDWFNSHSLFYKEQAEELLNQLNKALPGGTIDALLIALLSNKKSLLRIGNDIRKNLEEEPEAHYIPVFDNDNPEIDDDGGSIAWETYLNKASKENARKKIDKMSGKFGKGRIAKLTFIE